MDSEHPGAAEGLPVYVNKESMDSEHPGAAEGLPVYVNKTLQKQDSGGYMTPPQSTKFTQHSSDDNTEVLKSDTYFKEDSQAQAGARLQDSPRYVDSGRQHNPNPLIIVPPAADTLDKESEYIELDDSVVNCQDRSYKDRPLPNPDNNGNIRQGSQDTRQGSHDTHQAVSESRQRGNKRIVCTLLVIIVMLAVIILAGGGYMGWKLKQMSKNCATPLGQTVSICDDIKCSSACSAPSCSNCCGSGAGASVMTVRVGDNTIQAPVTQDGWLVFVKRQDGTVDFISPGWQRYKEGFGNLKGEFWLGNELLHRLTTNGSQWRLRVDMKAYSGECRYAVYDNFWVGSEKDFYQLHLSNYTGNAGDSLTGSGELWHDHDGAYFSTYDADHDAANDTNCALNWLGGWWYNQCFYAKFTGIYGEKVGQYAGVAWEDWLGVKTFLQYADMKISTK